MTKFNFQNPIFIITAISFLLVGVISISFLWPKFQGIETERGLLTTREQELQRIKDHFEAAHKDRAKLEGYQEQLAMIAFALPDDGEMNIPSLFRFLQIASAQTGLILTEIGPFTITPLGEEKPTLEKTQFRIEIIGSYPSLKDFLMRLERSARIIKVESISFSVPEEEGGLFTFNLAIKAHNYKEPVDIPPREEIKITVLELPILEKLEPFPKIEIEEEIGRENPFVPF